MNVSLAVRLLDQFSQPARRLRDNLRGTFNDLRAGFAGALRDGFSAQNIDAALANTETALNRAKGRLTGALGMAAAVAAPIVNLGRFETELVSFGNTAGIFGDDLQSIGDQLRVIGPQVNRTASEMLTALDYLVGKGLSPEQGIAALQAVGMTATATGADIGEMAAAGFSAMDNLSVPAAELQRAFDAMASSGKSGGFELRGMAQYFPALTASARSLKMEGVPAIAELGAALQIAMKGAGSESEAANNLQNFLSKLSSPETVKNFKDMGVDIEAEFQKASDDGVSVMEHMLEVIQELTDGNSFKMGELFGDQQVGNFLRPMMANMEEFRTIRDKALSADGINQGDFARVMDTMAERAKAVVIQLDNLSSSGSVLLDIAKDLASQIGAGIAAVNGFAQANPELARTLILVAAGMMALSIASRVASFALLGTRMSALGILNLFMRFDDTGKNIAIGWRLLAGAGGLLAGAFNVVVAAAGAIVTGLGAISAPVWGIIAVVVAAGFAIWKFWDRISSFVSGMAEALGGLLSPAMDAVGGAVDGLIGKLGELLGIDGAQMEAFKTAVASGFAAAFNIGPLLDGAKQLMSGFWSWLGGFFTQETLSDAEKGQMRDAGRRLIEDMWNGIQEKFGEVLASVSTWPSQIAAAIGTIDLTGMIQMPQIDIAAWWAGVTGTAPPPPPPPPGRPYDPASNVPALAMPALGAVAGQAETTINAEVVDKRPPQVTVHVTAPVTVTGVSDPRAAANQASGQLAAAVGQATSGALHDGMD